MYNILYCFTFVILSSHLFSLGVLDFFFNILGNCMLGKFSQLNVHVVDNYRICIYKNLEILIGSKEKYPFAKESGPQSNIGPSPIQEATIARPIEMRKQL